MKDLLDVILTALSDPGFALLAIVVVGFVGFLVVGAYIVENFVGPRVDRDFPFVTHCRRARQWLSENSASHSSQS